MPRTMALVLLASSPAAGLGLYLFGWPALNLLMVTIAAALLSETLSLWLMGKPVRSSLFDGSALLTAWLLALTLPPWAPWWIGALGGAFAILIGKQVFGGIGQNLFNPAMLARVALLISFPLEMTTWAQPHPLFAADSPDFLTALSITFGTAPHIDGMTSATVMGYVKTGFTQGHTLSQSLTGHFAPTASLLGDTNGSLGET
ncbi:MAG: RnfABCDGE type electron transport complex subunit D, partial [Gammaproteobacteria bacterium]